MYWAKQRASLPVSMGSSTTSHVGSSMVAGRPASLAAFWISAGAMSDPPTMYSLLSSSPTVRYPFIPMKRATAPNTISTAPEMNPPISQTLLPFIALPPDGFLRALGSSLVDGDARAIGRSAPTRCGELREPPVPFVHSGLRSRARFRS